MASVVAAAWEECTGLAALAWADGVAPAWADGVVPAWVDGVATALWRLPVLGEWESLVQEGSLVQAGLLGQAEAIGPAPGGLAIGVATDGLAGAVEAGGPGGVQVPVSHWPPPHGHTMAVTATVTLVSSGCPITVG